MKKIFQGCAMALSAVVAVSASAEAQNFAFSTASCFYTGTTACSTFGTSSDFNWNSNKSTITFNAASVNGTANGTGLFSNFLLGTFAFDLNAGNGTTSTVPSDLKMRLRVDFTSPVGVTPSPYAFAYADIDGSIKSVSGPDQGNISWDFSVNSVTFSGGPSGSFLFTVADGSTGGLATSGEMRGSIQCLDGANNSACVASAPNVVVPEPSTYLLIASGLIGIGMVARRRRNAA